MFSQYIPNMPNSPSIEKPTTNIVYYSLNDQNCGPNCPSPCKSKMKSFMVEHGEYLDRVEHNLIDEGGSGRVYREKWHGQDAAFKFVSADHKVPAGEILLKSRSFSYRDICKGVQRFKTEIPKRLINEIPI